MNSRPATDEIVSYGSKAVPTLISVIRRTDSYYGGVAISLLGMIGPPAMDAVPVLRQIALGPGGEWSMMPQLAFTALCQIIPGDPSLVELASQMAAQGKRSAVGWLSQQGVAGQPALLKLAQAAAEPGLDLLKYYVASGATLTDIQPQLLHALEPVDPARLSGKSSYEQDQAQAPARWAQEALDSHPADRLAILTGWAKHYAELNDGAQAYLISHVQELAGDQTALVTQAMHDSSNEVQKAAAKAITQLPLDRSTVVKDLIDLIEREDFYNGCFRLAECGAEGLAELHRLALENRMNVSSYAVQAIWTNAEKLGPEVYSVLYDIFRHAQGNAKYEAQTALAIVSAHPEAHRELMQQVSRDLETADEPERGNLLGMYVYGVYGPGPGPKDYSGDNTPEKSCAEGRKLLSWFEDASQRDPSVLVRSLAKAKLAELQVHHREHCPNPACPMK